MFNDTRTIIDRLGDTIHTVAIYHAMMSAGLWPKRHTTTIHERFAALFIGENFPYRRATRDMVFTSIEERRFGRGPFHNQHVRDHMAWCKKIEHLDLTYRLPIIKPVAPLRIVVFCPYAVNPSKEWPMDNWRKVAEEVRSYGYQVMTNAKTQRYHLVEGLGRMSFRPLPELAETMLSAAAVIGVDSGHLHLADALGIAPIGLYATTSSVAYGPYSLRQFCVDRHREAWRGVGPYNTTTFNQSRAMRAITVDDVIQQLRACLRQTQASAA